MFDQFYGDINGHNIYDMDYLDQMDNYNDAEISNSKGYYKMKTREKQEPAPKVLEGKIARETEKAFLFKFNDSENWLPKSQVKIKKKKDNCVVEIPDWLWRKMNEID